MTRYLRISGSRFKLLLAYSRPLFSVIDRAYYSILELNSTSLIAQICLPIIQRSLVLKGVER